VHTLGNLISPIGVDFAGEIDGERHRFSP
jgi:hypothetical protein